MENIDSTIGSNKKRKSVIMLTDITKETNQEIARAAQALTDVSVETNREISRAAQALAEIVSASQKELEEALIAMIENAYPNRQKARGSEKVNMIEISPGLISGMLSTPEEIKTKVSYVPRVKEVMDLPTTAQQVTEDSFRELKVPQKGLDERGRPKKPTDQLFFRSSVDRSGEVISVYKPAKDEEQKRFLEEQKLGYEIRYFNPVLLKTLMFLLDEGSSYGVFNKPLERKTENQTSSYKIVFPLTDWHDSMKLASGGSSVRKLRNTLEDLSLLRLGYLDEDGLGEFRTCIIQDWKVTRREAVITFSAWFSELLEKKIKYGHKMIMPMARSVYSVNDRKNPLAFPIYLQLSAYTSQNLRKPNVRHKVKLSRFLDWVAPHLLKYDKRKTQRNWKRDFVQPIIRDLNALVDLHAITGYRITKNGETAKDPRTFSEFQTYDLEYWIYLPQSTGRIDLNQSQRAADWIPESGYKPIDFYPEVKKVTVNK